MVSTPLVLALVALAALSVAVWIDMRFPSLAPETLRGALVHVGISLLAGQTLVPLAVHTLGDGPGPARIFMVAGIAFPVLVYSLLAAIWIIKIWREAYRRFSH